MTEITVKVQIDLSAETKDFLKSVFMPFGMYTPCACGVINSEEAEQTKSQAADPQPQPEVKAEEVKPAPQPEPEKVPQKAEQKAEDPKPAAAAKKYKTEDVRAAMASKLADHRVDLVNKLKDMGAKNVSSLPEDKYEEFINFCNSL